MHNTITKYKNNHLKHTIMKKSFSNLSRIFISAKHYDQLLFVEQNRNIKPKHVKRMKESVLKHGVLRLVIVVFDDLTGKYVIVDGQHLAKSLMELGREIECQIVDLENETHLTQLMIDLNNISESWKLFDYVHGWAMSGKRDYKILKQSILNSGLQETVVLMAYARKSRGLATKELKQGTFKITDKKYGDTIINYVKECNNYLPSCRAVNQALVELIVSVGDYNHKQMIKALKNDKTFVLSNTESNIYNQLVNIYKS